MILDVAFNVQGFIYICLYCLCLVLCYFIVLAIRIEHIFRKGSIWQIRASQIILAMILAYFLAKALFELIISI